jgi:thioester reductase-like protein
LKELYPDFKQKIIGIEGDMLDPHLGISPENQEMLANKIHVVFHSAATVRFDEPLK